MKIESIEEYDRENAKLELFVDSLEQQLSTLDFTDKEFWRVYGPLFTTMDHALESSQQQRDNPYSEIYTGGSQAHSDVDHHNRIFYRQLFRKLQSGGILKENEKDVFMNAMPNFGDDPDNFLSKKTAQQVIYKELDYLQKLKSHMNNEEINRVLINSFLQNDLFNDFVNAPQTLEDFMSCGYGELIGTYEYKRFIENRQKTMDQISGSDVERIQATAAYFSVLKEGTNLSDVFHIHPKIIAPFKKGIESLEEQALFYINYLG